VALIAALFIIFFFVLIVAFSSIKIVQPYQRGVKERLGKYRETLDPGLRMIVPFVDKIRLVDMREQVVDVPPQEVITADNVVVSVDAVIYYEPTDPQRLVYNIANFILAVTKLAQTNLRNVVGDMQLDEALTSRDKINLDLRQILDDATDKWGVRVVRVEIQRIDPPPDVMSALHEQMKAERTRRAVVTEADGRRQAVITIAQGDKESAVLRAEVSGNVRSCRLRATPKPPAPWPRPSASASSPWPRARRWPSPPSSTPSTPATHRRTSWRSSTSRPSASSPTARPRRSSSPPTSPRASAPSGPWPSCSPPATAARPAAANGRPSLGLISPATWLRPTASGPRRPPGPPDRTPSRRPSCRCRTYRRRPPACRCRTDTSNPVQLPDVDQCQGSLGRL
jgi:regulator of protease activity HflC (stomatin/prohibitin superfamily)